ncbi:hypothetical protein NT6N_28910 [Oceaniferula spumae]|uniref:Polysaccharide lyase 14 domain-containing protein n=1 Tax=Oceaniferula spumae TaxID=2979115 RepID=A0AAT9FPC6_9BACT
MTLRLAGIISLLTVGAAPCAEPILLTESFNSPTKSGLAEQLLQHKHVALAKSAGPDGSDAIRVTYVPYPRGSERVVSRFPLGRKVTRATLSFDVCFDRDFDFRKGGKLHGLGPQKPVTGGNPRSPERWSARLMFEDKGHARTYIYDQNPKAKYGIGNKTRGAVFSKGVWHRVDLQVALNTSGNSNGFVLLVIDGKKVASSDHLNLRGKDSQRTLIQTFLFSTFHGGHDPSRSPRDAKEKPVKVHALFDNISVSEGLVTSPRIQKGK